jgi:hypothetical protein
MYIKCHKCHKPIHYINIIISPDKTIETNILAIGNMKLQDLWGADIKCDCGHSHSGPIIDSPKGIRIGQAEYEVIK